MLKFFLFTLIAYSGIFMNTIAQENKKLTMSINILYKAMIDADKAVLDEITAEELSYGHSSGKIENKNNFIESLTSGKSDFVNIDLSEQQVSIVGSTAIVRHKLQAETNDSGKAGSANLYILLVWQKQKGKWKLLARQAVKAPQPPKGE